jgi:hypothetical protein
MRDHNEDLDYVRPDDLHFIFTVTIVMGQNLFPHNLGVASGLLVGFAIGAGKGSA